MTIITPTPLSTKELIERNNRNIQLRIIDKIKSLPPIKFDMKFLSNNEVYSKPFPKEVNTNFSKN